MGKREEIIKKLAAFKKDISSSFQIKKMLFFGSWAEGTPRKDSDIDLLVVSPYFEKTPCGRGKELYSRWNLDYPVDFICYTPAEFKKLSKRISLARMALEKGIEIA